MLCLNIINKVKLKSIILKQLKQTSRVNVNNVNCLKISSRMLFNIIRKNYNVSYTTIVQDWKCDYQKPILLNNVITRQYSVRHNFSYASHYLKHPWIISPVLYNGERHQIFHGSQSYNGIRYFSNTSIDSISEVKVPMQSSGIFKTLSESMPIKIVQESLLWMHDYTGLPWWLVIVLSTVIMRTTVTLPLSFYQHFILAKLENLKLEMNEIAEMMKKETNYAVSKYNWPRDYAMRLYAHSMKKQWNNLIVRENCHPAKASILVLVQVPLWISLSISIRNLCYMLPKQDASAYATYQEFQTDGFLWFTNLTVADPFVLPIVMGLFNLTIIEINNMTRAKETTKLMKYMIYFLRIVAIGMIPIAMYVPSCVSLYWATSSAFGLVQNLVMLSPRLRRLARVPVTASESPNPYSLLREKIITRYNLKRKMDNLSKM